MAIFQEVLRKETKLREITQEFQSDFKKAGIRNGVILCETFGNEISYAMFGRKCRIERNFKNIDAEIVKKFIASLYNMECIKENNCRIHCQL